MITRRKIFSHWCHVSNVSPALTRLTNCLCWAHSVCSSTLSLSLWTLEINFLPHSVKTEPSQWAFPPSMSLELDIKISHHWAAPRSYCSVFWSITESQDFHSHKLHDLHCHVTQGIHFILQQCTHFWKIRPNFQPSHLHDRCCTGEGKRATCPPSTGSGGYSAH